MADQSRPNSPQQAPDPSQNYERSDPDRESAGELDSDIDQATPADSRDKSDDAVPNKQDGTRQVNAHDAVNQRGGPAPAKPS